MGAAQVPHSLQDSQINISLLSFDFLYVIRMINLVTHTACYWTTIITYKSILYPVFFCDSVAELLVAIAA